MLKGTDVRSERPGEELFVYLPEAHSKDPSPPAEARAIGGLAAAGRFRRGAKRAMDVVGSLALLLLVLPVFAITALAVLTSSPGPIFFRQERVGESGRRFPMLKFRSMYRNAHYIKPQLLDLNEQTGPVFKIRRDPRVTPVGRIIRRLSIDELPQLLNVLAGHMSLVGPRPPLPEEWDQYGPRERQRLLVRPGVTCIWQVSGRSTLDFDTWLEMDLRYIREWTLWLDVRLLLRTIPAVLSGRGAY